MIKKVAGTALVGLLSLFINATPARADIGTTAGRTADSVITEQLARYQIPGAAVVIVAEGRQVYAQGYGVADAASRTPVDPAGTSFYLGSVAKVFTANAVAQLVASGKLRLDADVNSYLTTFKIKDAYPGQPITVENLLTHTSGFEDVVLGVATPTGEAIEPLGRWLAEHQPARVRAPGTLASYDNYGVALAGQLVELVSGQPFADYVQQHVFDPLGMSQTRVNPPHASLATGYRSDGSRAEDGQHGPVSPTGAGVAGRPVDLGRYMIAQLKPGNPLLDRRFAQDSRLPGMGLIFEEHPRNGRRVLSKDGDIPGYHDNLALLPNEGVGVYVVYNGDGLNGAATFAGHDLVNKVIDALYPGSSAPSPVDGNDLSRYEGSYRTTRYNHGDYTKFAQLTSAVTVTAENGGLTTTGLADDPDAAEQHWLPTGDAVFTERDGQAQLAFHNGVLLSSVYPTVAYERLAWYQNPMLHLSLLGLALVALLYAMNAWPISAIKQRRLGRGPLLARLVGWLVAALGVTVVGLLAAALGNPATLNERVMLDDSVLLHTSLILAAVMAALAAVMLVIAVIAWWRRWWRVPGRLGYTATTLAAVAFVGVATAYNLI